MKYTLTETRFVDLFMEYRKDQFSVGALRAIFEHLEEWDENMEFDPCGICCDFCEYDSATEAASEHDWEPDPDMDEDENEESAMEYLQWNTTVLETGSSIVIIPW